jgi:co-chaperonin GroES (HSP10)
MIIPVNGNVLCKRISTDETVTESGIVLNSEIKEGDDLVKAEVVKVNYNSLIDPGATVIFKRNII